MLEIIYASLALAILILAVVYLIFSTVLMSKKKYLNVASIKVRLVFTSILFALFIIKIILAIVLGKSIGNDTFCAILWAICTVIGYLSLKDAKNKTVDYDFSIMKDWELGDNEDVIDVDFTEVQDENSNE